MERVPHLPTDSELNKCYIVCDSEWTPNDVDQFKNLVRQSYGYRLYIDDLPSKPRYKLKGNAGHNIPLGYETLLENSRPGSFQAVKIFNHLDFIVTVQEDNFKIKILKFEVRPRSVPHGWACV